MLSIQRGRECGGGRRSASDHPVLSTNIYLLTDRGWRMLIHHASALALKPPREAPPSVLH
jgi:hypothetical protein